MGGIHSTALDLTRCLHYFVNPDNSPLKRETAREMLQNHCAGLNQPWVSGGCWPKATTFPTMFDLPGVDMDCPP